MPAKETTSPFAFLTALSGSSLPDRQIIAATRGTEVKIVSHMVFASKVSTLYAFSGNGKSSLIGAGLIPSFLDLGFAVFKTRPRPPYALSDPTDAFKEGCIRENWLPTSADDRSTLLQEARAQLNELPEAALPGVRRLVERFATVGTLGPTMALERSAGLRAHLRKHVDRGLPDFFRAAREFLGVAAPMVVICDQFEELFVHYYNSARLRSFAEALRDLCDATDLQIHLLFSMREDWVGSMITLRDVIPDILNSAYRLDPMRVSVAAPALSIPAENAGVPIVPDVTNQILAELAAFYRRQQGVVTHMSASVDTDPFIELPALQIVGDHLWNSLPEGATTITKAHYLGAVRKEYVARAGSPAAAILERYLFDILDTIDADERRDDTHLRDLRIDALYLLTDKSEHRRALGRVDLIAELKMIRASAGRAPDDHGNQTLGHDLERALRPLKARRLVQVSEGGNEGPRYELAHDFMVRSIVRAWNALDLRRAEERGLQEERRRQALDRLHTLSQFVDSGNRVLYGALALSAAAMAVFGVALHSAFTYESYYYSDYFLVDFFARYVHMIAVGAAAAVVGAAAAVRNRAGVVFGLLAGIAAITVPRYGSTWPVPNLLMNQWLVAMACLIPAIGAMRQEAPASTRHPHRWRAAAVLGLDYGLISLVVAGAMWSVGYSDYSNPAVTSALVGGGILFALQLALAMLNKTTLGTVLLGPLALHVLSKRPPGTNAVWVSTRARIVARLLAIFATYAAAWFLLLFSTLEEGFLFYPMGNPLYVGLHIMAAWLLVGYASGWGMFSSAQPEPSSSHATEHPESTQLSTVR